MISFSDIVPLNESEDRMPYAVLEKEIERLDETQQNIVVLFVRFLLSQKSHVASSVSVDDKPHKYSWWLVKSVADRFGFPSAQHFSRAPSGTLSALRRRNGVVSAPVFQEHRLDVLSRLWYITSRCAE